MKQVKIQSISGMINAGGLILGGVTDLSASIGMHFNTQTQVAQELTDLVMACGDLEQEKQTKVTRRSALVDSINNARFFVRSLRDILKLVLGYEYSVLWMIVGFQDSLEVPTTAEDLNPMLQAIILYLTNNPTLEVAGLNITAARAQALFDALAAAQNALAAQEMTVETSMNARDGKLDVMRIRMGAVIKELSLRLSPLDPRWLRFGLNMPGADETPDGVFGVKVTIIGPTAAAVKWDAAVRASYYRVYIRVLGVDADYRAVGSPADLDFTIENLPANATIDVIVAAVNTGGEGARSEAIRIVTH